VGSEPKLLRTLRGLAGGPPPVWIMRQAGRYLPEYRKIREAAGSFLDLCYNPQLAAEVTLQPVRRFDLDAAILFSDILVIPDALGQRVAFVEGEGPVLEPLGDETRLGGAEAALERLAPVLETVARVRRELAPGKALIGFCGAPFTVATYMIAGRGTPAQIPARRMALAEPARFERLIERLVEVSAAYLVAQLKAGADVVKIFDSWAGILDAAEFERWAVQPAAAIVERVRAAVPGARIIAFPRGAGIRLGAYAERVKADAVAVDWTLPMTAARALVQEPVVLQGNLDPLRLVVGGEALDAEVDAILAAMAGRPHIFNLGHGITPDTPVENVARLVERVRAWRGA
jgi:uroporphyrinogen decarboxylase